MATFSRASFNTAIYSSFRPTYPRQLFDYVFQYHNRTKGARWDLAVDLGCGTGQATTDLTQFKRVIGVDPSDSMVVGARKYTESLGVVNCEYVRSPAEDLHFLEDGSADLIVAAQAAHWFDWSKLWPEVARVLRKGGSAAFWIYSEFRIQNHQSLTPLITQYSQPQDADPRLSLGPHWQRPGRTILENHLLDVPDANQVFPEQFSDWERIFFVGEHYPALPSGSTRPIILRKKMTWDDLLSYFQTWSSLHTYRERYPEDRQNPEGDISVRFWNQLKGDAKKDDEIVVEWPVAMILAKKA